MRAFLLALLLAVSTPALAAVYLFVFPNGDQVFVDDVADCKSGKAKAAVQEIVATPVERAKRGWVVYAADGKQIEACWVLGRGPRGGVHVVIGDETGGGIGVPSHMFAELTGS
jgi:hypothetical protein